VIVCEDADVDMVVRTTGPAKFGSAGQSCVAPSRYLVHRSRYEEFTAVLGTYAESLKTGHGNDPDVTMGSLPGQAQVDGLARLTEDAVARGARILCGGEPLAAPGFYFAPTVLVDVPLDAEIMTTEPFGPIACVLPYDDFTDAIHIANSTSYGFAAYLFTDSLSRRNQAVRELQASNIGVNQMAPSLPDAPLGGSLDSGYGYEGGADGILAFMQLRLVSQSAP
jgi:succinate-semialdehyde dehydrogenase/glutarate-semialdehyde dehydrogenase